MIPPRSACQHTKAVAGGDSGGWTPLASWAIAPSGGPLGTAGRNTGCNHCFGADPGPPATPWQLWRAATIDAQMALDDYTSREAEERDLPGIERLFERHNGVPVPAGGWAVWKYRQSPEGHARVFVAETSDRTIVGTVGYLPRRFRGAASGDLDVMQAIDIFVRPDLRTKGVFLRLIGFAGRHVDVPKVAMPNASSRVFGPARAGWRVLGRNETWQFPIRIGRLVAGDRSRLMAPIVDGLCWVYHRMCLPRRHAKITLRPVGRFERDYALGPGLIHGTRSADYLNWRFVDNPLCRYACYEFLVGNESIGYCVYARDDQAAVVTDFVTTRHRRGCLRRLIDHARGEDIERLIVQGVGLELRPLGFVRRGASPDCLAVGLPAGRWVVTGCDTDAEVMNRVEHAPDGAPA